MKLVILEPLGISEKQLMDIAKSKLSDKDVDIIYYDIRLENEDSLVARCKDADIALFSNIPFRKNVIEKCLNLKMICAAFTGLDHIDLEYCKNRGIEVRNCAGYSTAAVSELVFGMIIEIYRKLAASDTATRNGQTKTGLIGNELSCKKFGVVGTGAIGMKVITIAKAFDCDVYAYSRTEKEIEGVKYVDLDTLMANCDIISLHVPSTPETHRLINSEKISLMKPNAILINTSRGPVLDSTGLANALNQEKIAAAGIDVFEMEPPIPKEHPLLNAKNVLLTPHLAFATKESMVKRANIAFSQISNWIAKTQ